MKKRILIILFAAASVLLITAGIILQLSGDKTPTTKKEDKDKTAAKAVVNGDMSNIEETLLAQHVFENYRIKGIQLSKVGPYYVFSFTIDNIGETTLEPTHLNIKFLSSSKKVLGEMDVEIPELAAGASTFIEDYTPNEAIYDAFDFVVSKSQGITTQE